MRSRAFKIFISIILIISLVLGLAAPASAAVVADDIIVSIVLSILASWGMDVFITEFQNNESFTAQVIQYIDDFVGNIRPVVQSVDVPAPGVLQVSKTLIEHCYSLAGELLDQFAVTPRLDIVVPEHGGFLTSTGDGIDLPTWSILPSGTLTSDYFVTHNDTLFGDRLEASISSSYYSSIEGYVIPRGGYLKLIGDASLSVYPSVERAIEFNSNYNGNTRLYYTFSNIRGATSYGYTLDIIQQQPAKLFIDSASGRICLATYTYYYANWYTGIFAFPYTKDSFGFYSASSSGDSFSLSAGSLTAAKYLELGAQIAALPQTVYLSNGSTAAFETLQTGAAALSEWLVSGADVGTSTLPDQPAIYESLSTIVDTQAGIYSNTRAISQTLTDVLAQVASIAEAAVSFFADIPFYLAAFAGKFVSIWHYVVDWLSSISGFMSSMGSIWSRLPYALVVPMYASIALTIIVGMYRRFFM